MGALFQSRGWLPIVEAPGNFKHPTSILAMQLLIPHNTRISIKHESFLTKFLKSKKPSRIVYKKLVSEKSESPNQSQQKWQEDIILMTKQELNWKEAYQMAFQCTKSTKLITFNLKFLRRRISTHNFLKKIVLAKLSLKRRP